MNKITATELKRNFISADKIIARDSYGQFFKIGESVKHEDSNAEKANIISFQIDEESEEIKVYLDNGKWAHLDFLVKL